MVHEAGGNRSRYVSIVGAKWSRIVYVVKEKLAIHTALEGFERKHTRFRLFIKEKEWCREKLERQECSRGYGIQVALVDFPESR